MKSLQKSYLFVVMALLCLLVGCSKVNRVPAAKQQLQEQLDLGARYLQELNYEQALAAYTAAIELEPDNSDIYVLRGNVYALMEEYPEATDDYTQAIELDEQNISAYLGRGDVYLVWEEPEDHLDIAFNDYDQAVALDETCEQGYLGLANVYTLRDELEEAIDVLRRALDIIGSSVPLQDKLDALVQLLEAGPRTTATRVTFYNDSGAACGQIDYTYDENGRIVSSLAHYYGGNGSLGVSYDLTFDDRTDGTSGAIWFATDRVIEESYSYDENGRWVQTAIRDYAVSADGNMQNTEDSFTTTIYTNQYDENGILSKVVASFEMQVSSDEIEGLDEELDFEWTSPVCTYEYTYDDEGRIIKSSSSGFSLDIDGFGFDESEVEVFDAMLDILEDFKISASFSYDSENRLTKCEVSSTNSTIQSLSGYRAIEYSYNPDGSLYGGTIYYTGSYIRPDGMYEITGDTIRSVTAVVSGGSGYVRLDEPFDLAGIFYRVH